MTPERYRELELDYNLKLTPEEVAAGWHFCMEWDGMLINRHHKEGEACFCYEQPTDKA